MMDTRADILETALAAIDSAADEVSFSDLLAIASRGDAFDRGRHLRFADWSGVDFAGSDLAGCDFSGALLAGCNFAGARISGARFDGARIDSVPFGGGITAHRSRFRDADDWQDYVGAWKPPPAPLGDEHLLAGTVFQDAPFAPEMVVVPPGTFRRSLQLEDKFGIPKDDMQQVSIARAFAVGRFAVTFDEWKTCVQRSGSSHEPDDEGWGRGQRPVINVSWNDATSYVEWLSRETGKTYRLLSEAEREYVARARALTPYWWGATVSTERANYNGSESYGRRSRGANRMSTVTVDSFDPNPWGLYNVHGNVWEWVQDTWNGRLVGAPTDGSAWMTGDTSQHVLKGGCWENSAEYLRAEERNRSSLRTRGPGFGFRVARDLET